MPLGVAGALSLKDMKLARRNVSKGMYVKRVLVAGVLGIASIGAAWGLTSTPATAAPAVQNTDLAGVVPRGQIEANVRYFKWPRIDRLETKLGTMSSFLAI